MASFEIEEKEYKGIDPISGRENVTTYMVSGQVSIIGPYQEVDYIKIENLEVLGPDGWEEVDSASEIKKIEAEYILENAAREQFERRRSKESLHVDERDQYEDDHEYSSGPDYWTDPESGEWRCG